MGPGSPHHKAPSAPVPPPSTPYRRGLVTWVPPCLKRGLSVALRTFMQVKGMINKRRTRTYMDKNGQKNAGCRQKQTYRTPRHPRPGARPGATAQPTIPAPPNQAKTDKATHVRNDRNNTIKEHIYGHTGIYGEIGNVRGNMAKKEQQEGNSFIHPTKHAESAQANTKRTYPRKKPCKAPHRASGCPFCPRNH